MRVLKLGPLEMTEEQRSLSNDLNAMLDQARQLQAARYT